MRKLIPLLLAALCLTGCAKASRDADSLNAAVLSVGNSVTAKNAYELLDVSSVATLDVHSLDASQISALSDYDMLYIDKSVYEFWDFDKNVVQEYVKNGGSVFLDNELYDLFDLDFIGAESFVPIDFCPTEMLYPACDIDGVNKIQTLIRDFCGLYKNYANFNPDISCGVGVIPSTAKLVAETDGVGIYTINQYGDGLVFFTSPLLPNTVSVGNLSPNDEGEYLSATTVGANKLIRDYFAEMVSLKKYGYAVETVFGSFARPAAAWELHYEDITGIENASAEIFEEMCERYGQVPSFTLARNPYVWFRRAESVTYALNNDGQFAMDPYENAYSSGTHFVSGKNWLSLDYYDNTISYFEPGYDYIKRAYPAPVDFNRDGNMDLIVGSADGKLYCYEGSGMRDNYELGLPTMFTDADGTQIGVGAYSSPDLADLDNDGVAEIITGDENGSIHCFKPVYGMTLDYLGVILETGLTDAMPALGDLNGDGIIDMAVGSRTGEMRIYYGEATDYGTAYGEYEAVEPVSSWCAPCIADVNNDGANELYSGTFEGYIAGYENGLFLGYLEGNECNFEGNIHLKFGANSVPRFYDIDGDGEKDLVVGSLEYGMAIPIDSKYFPYRDKLQNQIDGFKERGIYVGVHVLSHEHADMTHDARELQYQKDAFKSYGLDFVGSGANQHTWRTSKIGYDANYGNMSGYDGTYKAQIDAGLFWNSGSQTPNSIAVPEVSAENSILVPFYLDNGQLMLQPCNTPNGHEEFTDIAARYSLPLLFYNHCDYVYREQAEEEEKIKEADAIVNDYGYSFVQENQLAKMAAAALNTKVNAKWENDSLYLSAAPRSTDIPLYDKAYQNSVGVKIILAGNVNADEFNVDAGVSYKKDNCVYLSLDRDAVISKSGENLDVAVTAVNLPARISKNKNGAEIKFLDGGMMTAEVNGSAKTTSDGWEVTQQNGKTTFRKYGKKETLRIVR